MAEIHLLHTAVRTILFIETVALLLTETVIDNDTKDQPFKQDCGSDRFDMIRIQFDEIRI